MAEVKSTVHRIETLKKPITAEDFFQNYILKRKPVKFSFVSDDLKKATEKWRDNDYLIAAAGKSTISTEVRKSSEDRFGVASKQQMQFSEFLNLLNKNKEEKYYLTVQQIETNEFGPKSLYTAPLNNTLMSDIPLKPSILKYLELFQINVWIGHSPKGTSSKLHHDFHDNLYTVIRGQKQFVLFPPKSVDSLYTNGYSKLCNVFDNGLITYNDDFREDGASKISVEQWEMINDDDDDDNKGFVFDDDQMEMDETEQLLDELINKKMNDDADDDFDDLDDSMNHNEEIQEPPLKKKRLDPNEEKEKESDPLSFSQINVTDDKDIIMSTYPKYANVCKSKQVITVNEGEMLYLPCGWFHDVTSFSNSDLNSHFALNYWMHPPITAGSMEQPYCDDFWKKYNQQTFFNNLK